jgi:hypothetical protein
VPTAERAGRATTTKAAGRHAAEVRRVWGAGLGFYFFADTWCFGSGQDIAQAVLHHTGPSTHDHVCRRAQPRHVPFAPPP